jgi:hypothetical protein
MLLPDVREIGPAHVGADGVAFEEDDLVHEVGS